jgi:hypothetical protein
MTHSIPDVAVEAAQRCLDPEFGAAFRGNSSETHRYLATRAAIQAALPHLVAEKDAEIAWLRRRIKSYEDDQSHDGWDA